MREFLRHILVLASVTMALPVLAHACSCSGPGPIPCNLLLKESPAIFVGRVVEVENPPNPDSTVKPGEAGLARYTFAVTEAFAGTSGGEAIVYSGRGGADCSYHFKKGEQYLVYAYKASDQTFHATICSRTQPAAGAEILLRQLRAAREHKPVASVYGVLQRTQQPYDGTWNGDYDQPIANTKVHLRLKDGKVFTTRTDGSGAYAFYDLPAGTYQVSADLSQSLAVAQTILSDPPRPIGLPVRSCYQYDIEAMPQTNIIGHLVNPDGTFAEGSVELFSQEVFAQQQKSGWWEYAKGQEGFRFNRVAPGNYILIFNNSDTIDPDAPYPRTFYPGVTDPARMALIHVTEDDHDITADIHLSGGEETFELAVRLAWTGAYKASKQDYVWLAIHSDAGDRPIPSQSGKGLLTVRLLKRATYTVQGTAFCGSHQRVETNTVTIRGTEIFTSPIVLSFPQNACVQ